MNLQIRKKKLLLTLCIIVISLPYFLMHDVIPNSHTWLEKGPLLLLQVLSVGFVTFSYIKIKTKALKLFWQFITLALVSSLASNLLFSFYLVENNLLLRELFTLFCYFFILLAIETTPHITEAKVSKNISSRVAAILFLSLIHI